MSTKKNPASLGRDSWEIERFSSDDRLPCGIKKAHVAVVSDVEGADWTARLVDVSLGNPDVKNASFFSVLIRRVERGDVGWVSETHPTDSLEQSSETTGQDVRTISGQNPLWESRLAGLKGQPTCDPAGAAVPAFGDLATVRSMGTGQRSHVIGFDTEFTYVSETERVIDSYQFCCLDPTDEGARIDVVILPLQQQRILVEDALYIVVRAADLHRLVEDLHPRGVARRDFWKNGDYKGALDALFKHRVPLVLAGHYLPADLTAFARPARQRRGGEKYNDLLRRVTSASGGLVGLNPIRVVRRGGRSDGSRWMPMSVIVRDTMGQVAPGQKTLAALGKSCGVEKIDVGESISDMSTLRRDHLVEFLEYGANDSVIVLEYLGALWGLNTVPPVTISGGGARALRDGVMGYWGIDSPADFRMRFQGLVELSTAQAEGNDGDDGLSYYAVRDLAPVDGDANQTHTAWKKAFHGGWNGCIAPGYHPYPTYDHDIQSAYPSAMASIYDVDYVGGAIDKVIKDWELTLDDFDHGPITPMVAYASWEFPDDTVAPCLPVRSGDSVIYPLTSHGCGAAQGDEVDGYQGFEGAWCAGPELYLALQLGAQVTVQIGYTMRVMDAPDENEDSSRSLRSALRQMVADRAIAKEVFGRGSLEEQTIKVGTNSCYGKLAQDVAERNGWDAWEEQMESIGGSAVTSPYHASMTTSLVRALLLAVANEIEILSVTTDGFITAVEEIESLECFGIAEVFRNARLVLADDPTVWEVKHKQDDLINLSTRGNVSLSDGGVLAKAGLKTPKA